MHFFRPTWTLICNLQHCCHLVVLIILYLVPHNHFLCFHRCCKPTNLVQKMPSNPTSSLVFKTLTPTCKLNNSSKLTKAWSRCRKELPRWRKHGISHNFPQCSLPDLFIFLSSHVTCLTKDTSEQGGAHTTFSFVGHGQNHPQYQLIWTSFSKLDMQRFDDSDPSRLVYQMEQYFQLHNISNLGIKLKI